MLLKLAAPAKLNLYLHVSGKRSDGYHLLDGLVAFADIGDVLTIAPADRLSLTIDGPFASDLDGEVETNLVVRAARAVARHAGRAADVALTLTKTLPVASGIGGGSADAAACIRGLAQLWHLDAASPEIMAIAERLGSDIPVCVAGRAAYLGGIGADLAPAPDLPPTGLLLVNPRIGLPTPAVYRARTGTFTPPARFTDAPENAAALARLLAARTNDLSAAAMSLVPEIGVVLAALADLPGCLLARMSGSGATCFALFDGPEAARFAGQALRREQPGWWIEAGRLATEPPPSPR